ncbi:unnamed protein product [Closterium sp. NIES-64]|nr:unnamed protein product [Closterium sp. NIES-64]
MCSATHCPTGGTRTHADRRCTAWRTMGRRGGESRSRGGDEAEGGCVEAREGKCEGMGVTRAQQGGTDSATNNGGRRGGGMSRQVVAARMASREGAVACDGHKRSSAQQLAMADEMRAALKMTRTSNMRCGQCGHAWGAPWAHERTPHGSVLAGGIRRVRRGLMVGNVLCIDLVPLLCCPSPRLCVPGTCVHGRPPFMSPHSELQWATAPPCLPGLQLNHMATQSN